eukprot:5519020-Amphidinium_carterae.1
MTLGRSSSPTTFRALHRSAPTTVRWRNQRLTPMQVEMRLLQSFKTKQSEPLAVATLSWQARPIQRQVELMQAHVSISSNMCRLYGRGFARLENDA